jgi:sugar phosphate isomerase/epimerase
MHRPDSGSTAYTRRDFGQLVLAGLPLSLLLADINSKFKGVQIGAITYSFRTTPNPDDIIKAFVSIGLGEMELMSNHCETLAGAPSVPRGGRGQQTPEQTEERAAAQKKLAAWRASATDATFKPVRKKVNDAGIDLRVLCYNMNVNTTKDDEIEYAFTMAKGLGVKAMSTSSQVSMAKRLAPFAEKHKMMVGFHGHDQTDRADEVSTEQTFLAVMEAGKYLGANLDVGHYTSANGDPVEFIKKHHARITNLHLKDKKRDHGPYTPWGEGDAPLKDVLLLMSQQKYDIPANIEFEYQGDPMVEIPKCLQYCKDALK